MADDETAKRQREFMNLVLEASETGDDSKLADWWRKLYPGYKWWLIGPNFVRVLPDDGRDDHERRIDDSE